MKTHSEISLSFWYLSPFKPSGRRGYFLIDVRIGHSLSPLNFSVHKAYFLNVWLLSTYIQTKSVTDEIKGIFPIWKKKGFILTKIVLSQYRKSEKKKKKKEQSPAHHQSASSYLP